MPRSAPSICAHVGCGNLTDGRSSRCSDHPLSHNNRSVDAEIYNKLYKTARWERVRKSWLARHPLCAEHDARGRVFQATVVDHIIAHKGDETLFWDATNYQSLCVRCHNRKTARVDRHIKKL